MRTTKGSHRDFASELAALKPTLETFCDTWVGVGLPTGFAGRLDVRFNTRLRRTLGRCHIAEARIELAALLLEAPRPTLLEVACHEVAHAAVYALHGRGPRPHGPEWRKLMRLAEQPARARYPTESLPPEIREATLPKMPFAHRCPRCATERRTNRRRSDWRCQRCVRAGHSGRLEIEDRRLRTPTAAAAGTA